MTPDDIYSLESWLREKALEAHNRNCKDCKVRYACRFNNANCPHDVEEKTYNEVITKIQNMRCNQRPHVNM